MPEQKTSMKMLAKLLIVFLIVHLLAVITLILCFSSDHEVASTIVVPVSSVWCTGDSVKNRRCYFKNLCYSFQHDDFVFVRGKDSVLQGLPRPARKARIDKTAGGRGPPDAVDPRNKSGPLKEDGDLSEPPGGKRPLARSPHSNEPSKNFFDGKNLQSENAFGVENFVSAVGPLADLSGGVENHGNGDYFFSFVEIPDSAIREKNFTSSILPEKVLIFKRFKPDNLMHVIHDDLLPLYATLAELEHSGARDYRIFFADDYEEGDYWDLYRVFRSKTYLNSHHPLLKASLRAEVEKDANLVCFATASVGAVANTKWYQYGFDRYQGPSEESQVTGTEIRAFANFIRKGLEIPKYDIDMPRYLAKVKQRFPYAVLFNRRANRRILNEVELSIAISQELNLRTVIVNLETHSLSEIVHLLANATMLIGMHGAQLVLSMFLPVNSIVLEIYPYGIPAEDYTPYKTLASTEGLGLLYRAWENKNEQKTRTHPEYERQFGGISHHSREKQNEIISTVPVKKHFCCQDPTFLYRMYQDTEVDVKSFTQMAGEVYAEREARLTAARRNVTFHLPIAPSEIKNVNCSYLPGKNVFHIDWAVPWNAAFVEGEDSIRYVVRVAGDEQYIEYDTGDIHLEVPAGKDPNRSHVWISARLGSIWGAWTRQPGHCRR